ncbi:hypothetical protein C3Y87_06300 [Carbonactinospora thermoautotrophica]|uniref:helix-turn-helix domain-containing protein n=1 Tax=Carbonactinospora thermoautotrophica TaxID=1469144 RepID=UPI00226EE8F8|nr:helix-turn-helix domain-containing protein [Carbonactinospora thermoautotrophica]MCX9191025.1 hypothetical protein [Carbonactinospora thermoautotrophica]
MTVHHGNGERDGQTPVPNHQLRALRQQRNWSQQEFAEAIRDQAMAMGLNLACDEKRVGRWERGEVRWPSPAYRRVLQAVLNVPVSEMGFVPPAGDGSGDPAEPDTATPPEGAPVIPPQAVPATPPGGVTAVRRHAANVPPADGVPVTAPPGAAPLGPGTPAGGVPVTPITGVPVLSGVAYPITQPPLGYPVAGHPAPGPGDAAVPLAGEGLEMLETLEAFELIRRLEASDVGGGMLEALCLKVDRLCRDYPHLDAQALRVQAAPHLRYVINLLDGRLTLAQHRELLVIGGWLSALLGCVYYDMGHREAALASCEAAFRFGDQAGHRELMAWSYEMRAWFALSEGRYREVIELARAGQETCRGDSNARVQLTLQEAKGWARLGREQEAREAMERGWAALERLPVPEHPEHHFVFDRTKYDFYVASCFQWLGRDDQAERFAAKVFADCESRRPGWPMRYAETKIGLGVIAARRGDLEQAVANGLEALGIERKSGPSLMARAQELLVVLNDRYPKERLTAEYRERYLAARQEFDRPLPELDLDAFGHRPSVANAPVRPDTDGVICPACRERRHEDCRGGTWCDCQHRTSREVEPATGAAGE